MIRLVAFALALPFLASAAPEPSFHYDRSRPLDVKEVAVREQDDVTLRDITYAELDGRGNDATVVTPKKGGAGPGILFLHWYGPPEPTSNRTQFIPDAIDLARAGAVSLLIDTPWSDPQYMKHR